MPSGVGECCGEFYGLKSVMFITLAMNPKPAVRDQDE
jgi:hypothetical protein